MTPPPRPNPADTDQHHADINPRLAEIRARKAERRAIRAEFVACRQRGLEYRHAQRLHNLTLANRPAMGQAQPHPHPD